MISYKDFFLRMKNEMVITREITRIRWEGKDLVGCPGCGTFMDEPSANNFKCPVPDCGREITLPSRDRLHGNWKFRFCYPKDREVLNIPTVNLKTGAIGKIRIPQHILDDANYFLGETMEEVIERFGHNKGLWGGEYYIFPY